ncbi:serine hydroxymethyltransferase [Gemmatimonadota bacterium]
MALPEPSAQRAAEALQKSDPEIFNVLREEESRQRAQLELIASENFVSPAVLEALGSVLTNKYAEGLPGKRYYGGCEVVDRAEQAAIDRACALFDAEGANVQPHSGAQANMAVYLAFMKAGDTLMGLNLSHGGHLTHGHPVNFSGILYNVVQYGVSPETEMIDWDAFEQMAHEAKPQVIVGGASAYPRFWDFERMRTVADDVGAKLVIDMAHFAGLVATGHHASPVPWADAVTTTTHKTLRGPRAGLILCREEHLKAINSAVFPGVQGGPLMHVIAAKAVALKEASTDAFVQYSSRVVANAATMAATLTDRGVKLVSGGTDNHLLLIDLRPQGLTGKAIEAVLESAGITVNKNTVPFDEQSPFVTSGIRLGTPALTTRGMREAEFEQIATWIADIIHDPEGEATRARVEAAAKEMCTHFPHFAWADGVPD